MVFLKEMLQYSEGVPALEVRGCSSCGSPRMFRVRKSADVPRAEVRGGSSCGSPWMFFIWKSADVPFPNIRVTRFFKPARNICGVPLTEDPLMFRARNVRGTSVHGTSVDVPCGIKKAVNRMSAELSAADKDVPRRKSFGVPTDHPLFGGLEFFWTPSPIFFSKFNFFPQIQATLFS